MAPGAGVDVALGAGIAVRVSGQVTFLTVYGERNRTITAGVGLVFRAG